MAETGRVDGAQLAFWYACREGPEPLTVPCPHPRLRPQLLPGPTPGRRPGLLNAELAGPMGVQASAQRYLVFQKRRDCGSRRVGPAIRRPPLSGSDVLSYLIDAAQRAHTVRRTAKLAKLPLLRAASD